MLPYPLDEQLFMCSAVSYFQPDLIVEWGTHKGISARIFYEANRFLGGKAVIHSVDLPTTTSHVENIRDAAERARFVRGLPVTLHEGDGLSVARELHATIGPAGSPLFFLDGDHEYETVLRELQGIRGFARSATVLVHDTFNQDAQSAYNIGPFRALAEFAAARRTPVHSTALGLPGMSLTYW